MPARDPPPTIDVIEAVLHGAARALASYPWQPHRRFKEPAESVERLYARLEAQYAASKYGNEDFFDDLCLNVVAGSLEDIAKRPAWSICKAFVTLGTQLVADNKLLFPFPVVNGSANPAAAHHLRQRLLEIEPYLVHEARIREVFGYALSLITIGLTEEFPEALFPPEEDVAPFEVPLFHLVPNLPQILQRTIGTFLSDTAHDGDYPAALTFQHTRAQLSLNILTASRLSIEEAQKSPHKIVLPEAANLASEELIATYLGGTPLLKLFRTPVPFSIPLATRFEHMHIVGGAGHGKTQTLQHLIATDLAQPDPPSLIIIDSHGDMLSAIERLDCFHPGHGRLTDRLIIIDPEDVEHPPALNMFDMSSERLARYTPAQREQIEAATIELYDYIFRALSADLTSKQGVAFAFVARLLLTIPGATIHTLRELMEDQSSSIDKSPFHDAISQLDDTARAFFEGHFFTKAFVDTKRQIARRIYDFIRNKTFERMFSSPVNKLDMFEAMNSGSIVLVNTSKALLKSAASALFGRTIIALTLRAAFERVAIPPDERRPAFLIIDEAADYFDANVDALLTQVRKYKLGLVFAHQYLDQLDGGLRASFAANTAIKFAGGVSDKDARALAPDMRCRPEFITGQRKQSNTTCFATYVRNVTPSALSLSIPFGTLDRMPRMSADAQARLRDRNRQRYTVEPKAQQVLKDNGALADPAVPPQISSEEDDWSSGTRKV